MLSLKSMMIFIFLVIFCNVSVAGYDLFIEEYVGSSQKDVDSRSGKGKKDFFQKAGEYIFYKITYGNDSRSLDIPKGTIITADYDQDYLTINWLDPQCSHDGDKIYCRGFDYSPNQIGTFYYIAKIKPEVLDNVLIKNTASVASQSNKDDYVRNNMDYANVHIIKSASCGRAAQTYPPSSVGYENDDEFCTKGTAFPSSIEFPNKGETVTWFCRTNSESEDVPCTANRQASSSYDAKVDKYIGKNLIDVDSRKKSVILRNGDTVVVGLFYENLPSSVGNMPSVVMEDYYDQEIFEAPNLPNQCIDNGGKLVCQVLSLAPGQSHRLYYEMKLKSAILENSMIESDAILKSNDENSNNNKSSAKIFMKMEDN